MEAIRRELIYLWYYFSIQLDQIWLWWVLGMLTGSAVSVFARGRINAALERLGTSRIGAIAVAPAALLGVLSPLCMYGTVPIAAGFSRGGMRDELLAAFMMSSILLNPQLIMYSSALGPSVLALRIISCVLCGVAAGLLVRFCCLGRRFFSFEHFNGEAANRDTDPNIALRYLKSFWRNVKATGPMFLLGVLLSALFQRYVPAETFASLFGGNEGFGVLMAATVGVPLYACGGGTIPLLQQWLYDGMSFGAAAAFMITGPATKLTNLGALKIVLGVRHFAIYIAYIMLFALFTGLMTNIIF